MYDTILVPTDGSDTAEYAVEHAIDLAEKYGADVHALYVVDTSAIDVSLGTEQVDRIQQGKFGDMPELEQRANEATGVVAAKAEAHDIDVTEAVVAGQPHKQISNYAADNDVDLIVMGSAGRSGVRRALLGSVAERTLRSTTVPVLVVDRED
ncbi:UspA domain-containing protein [Natronococcus amylolyticus DSM 10524]|uniref:UspA domain-containing protein n=1 Tax=Natronococcus amylolyticus DSM 10524 TaxID=1227497 RepID=L9X638_9EURY|nr:universal stress protein [Natronococcus amylolyticus]ELY57279.1 UspA domain-containing protein [Natronococcus amylolyticus DSM 10524]